MYGCLCCPPDPHGAVRGGPPPPDPAVATGRLPRATRSSCGDGMATAHAIDTPPLGAADATEGRLGREREREGEEEEEVEERLVERPAGRRNGEKMCGERENEWGGIGGMRGGREVKEIRIEA